jgi:hypothetical protein
VQEYTVTVTSVVTPEMIADQMCAAVEGGCGYWCASLTPPDSYKPDERMRPWYANASFYSGDFVIEVIEHDEHTKGRGTMNLLTPDKMRTGLDLMANKHESHFNDMMQENGDATTADVFLQLCLFGELVYG